MKSCEKEDHPEKDAITEEEKKRARLQLATNVKTRRASIDSVGFKIPSIFGSTRTSVANKPSGTNRQSTVSQKALQINNNPLVEQSSNDVYNSSEEGIDLKDDGSDLYSIKIDEVSGISPNRIVYSSKATNRSSLNPAPAVSDDGDNRRSSMRQSAAESSKRGSVMKNTRRRLSFMVNNGTEDDHGSDGESDNDDDNLTSMPPRSSTIPVPVGRNSALSQGRGSAAAVGIDNSNRVSWGYDNRPTTVNVNEEKKDEYNEEEEEEEEEEYSSKERQKRSNQKMPTKSPDNSKSTIDKGTHSHFSMGSDMTDEGIITKWILKYEAWKDVFLNTDFYKAVIWAYESTRLMIYLYTILHIMILIAIALLFNYAIGTLVPSILFYNMIHLVMSVLGKFGFIVGLRSTQLISKEFTARNMIKRGKGVSLTSILNPIPMVKLNAEEGKTLRYIFLFSILLIEAVIWFLGIQMEWEPTISELGVFPCTKVRYLTNPDISSFASKLGNFLQGDSDLSMVYSFGLPLGDGVVGGMAAWPLMFPSSVFNVQQDGVGFAINAVCGDLQLALPNTGNGLTQFKILSTTVWSTMFSMQIQVQLPAGSHDWLQFFNSDITQQCDVRYIMGDANINFGFSADEWGGITSQYIESLELGNLTINNGESSNLYFGLMQNEFGINSEHENITLWVIEGTKAVFNNASYGTSQGAVFSNFFQWATLPDGYYHVDCVWKGVAAAMAMVAHYVLMQYDTGDTTVCSYQGMQEAGIIQCPQYVVIMAIIALVISLIAELSQLFWWFLLSGGGEKNDRAAKILESPMQLLYDIRLGGTNIMEELRGDNHSQKTINDHYENVLVRFGESRHTRPNPIGMLILGSPGEVMAMSEKREYY
ncbi:hypothetical protein HK100_004467 [Physocladia obscura]|uniref:Uncharacterized protein n=1 Tax=Physocladia obscura TaxID=109957 RepID=A0AAD5TC97_9FUNG|nr:hypothetical protein HK100_004467 [Physocladia obscura]